MTWSERTRIELDDRVEATTRAVGLRLASRPDLRRAHRLGHAEQDHAPLATAAGREWFVRYANAAVDVLPIIDDPDVARRPDGDIGLRLQATAHIAARR